MTNIALTGLARSGKDSVAARLVQEHGYVRVAFADKLKEAALKADPIIGTRTVEEWDIVYGEWEGRSHTEELRLSAAVAYHGWEVAKDTYPEVRRFLQDYGQTIREIDPRFWIEAAWPAAGDALDDGRPVVFTDVRYANEAEFLWRQGFTRVRVTRPGLTPGQHLSEREMLNYPADRTIVNDGTLTDLQALVDRCARQLWQ